MFAARNTRTVLDHTSIHIDRELFRRIAQGEEEAFNALFHAYVPRLHALVMKVTQSERIVKDIVQEVFLYLWLDRDALPAVEVPQNWIFKIAYNRSYSWMARQSSRDRKESGQARLQPDIAENTLEDIVSLHETARLIHNAVNELPPQARKIFRLSREAGLKPAEIAEQLGISIQTVRNSLVRSVKSIKTYLAEHGILLPVLLLHYFL